MNAYNIIKSKLTNNDYEFDVNSFDQLTEIEFSEINSVLIGEIFKGNSSCYKYIRFLKGLDIAKLMSTGHKQSLTEDNWIILAANAYLAYPKPSLLDHIVEMARGSYGYEPISLNDSYPYANELYQSKGVKL